MKTLRQCFFLLPMLLAIVCVPNETHATGGLFSRSRGSNQEYNKMWIKSMTITADIHEQIAVTHVDQVFFNEMNQSVEAVFIFPLPENAMVTELVYWVNGVRFVAKVRELQAARNAYNEKLRQWLDPALLEYMGDNLFRLSIVPINPLSEVHTEITYVEPLTMDFGKISYMYRLNTLELSSKPLEVVSLELNAQTAGAFKSFSSPTHANSTATQILAISQGHYTLRFGDENFYPDKDMTVNYELAREDFDVNHLVYTPVAADSFGTDSFFALWLTPPDSVPNSKIIAKEIIFAVDVSSSMEGERMAQAKQAMETFIDLLNPRDRFNIVTFGTFVHKFKPDLAAADATNIDAAHEFIVQLHALGLTNIDEALTASLQQSYSQQTSNNLIFLTDGLPTWGETTVDSIIVRTKRNNVADVRIFSFGVGDDVSHSLLRQISKENNGFARFITSDDSIALVVNEHFQRISKPVLKNISIDIEGLTMYDQYPKALPDLFWGSQILYMGLYKNSGAFNVKIDGELAAEPFTYSQTVQFSDMTGGNRFVPRIWAKAKIDHILDLIDVYGETNELVQQVIDLSLRFQILTRYTALYIDPDENDGDITGIDNKDENLPESFVLYQNYPNPFNPSTEIRFSLPETQGLHLVVIKIYDIAGRLVKVLLKEEKGAGEHSVTWNGLDSKGRLVASGIYVYEMKIGNFRKVKKMTLIR